ncbi:MAG TPA: alginate lyase family protein [Anaerohalosphaeraceae bacterium]|nr:alginate lyase family protein [Anaerohalosphaeraceae bacterium]
MSHQLDPSRKTAIRRCEFCSDIVDVYSPSIWAGWYRGKFTEYKSVSEAEMKKVKHFLHAEWGGDSHARRHSENPYTVLRDIQTTGQADERGLDYMMTGGSARASKDGDWSESYICDLIDWHLKEQETMNWLTGTAYWIFKDFSTPLRPDNPVPYMNQKGVVERDLTPKEAYYVFQSYWTQKPMVRIYSHTWPVRWGKDKENKTVKIYSNCSEAELFVNGKSSGKKKHNSQDFPAAGLRWSVPFKKGMNNLKAVAWKDGVEVSDEITFRYETRTWDQPTKLVLKEFQRRADSVTIQGLLMDSKGILCLDARNFVQFGLTGDGTLLDNLGTSRGARKVQLHNGQAMIDVQLNGGASTVSLLCNGYPTVFLNIESFSNKTNLKEVSRQERALYVAQLDRERIIKLATSYLDLKPISLRDYPAPSASRAGLGDYYSMGDYWWPNPDTPNGLPYVQRDGQSNPDNFSQHRMLLRSLRDAVVALSAAYALEKNEVYAKKAVDLLNVFFVDADKRMNPHLLYAQAIPGITDGRGIGIIDTLHLAEVPLAIEVLKTSNTMTPEILSSLKKWFADYAEWMITHPNGIQEMNAANNHSVAYLVQLAAFAKLTQDTKIQSMIRTRYKDIILPSQMDLDGSFPAELARTKPYGYSIFQLDNMVLLCHLLSIKEDNLWEFTLSDGRSIQMGLSFLFDYLKNKNAWPYPPDVEHFVQWPVRQPCLLLGAYAFNRPDYLALWKSLEADPTDLEIRRNLAVTQPLLWLIQSEDVPLLR